MKNNTHKDIEKDTQEFLKEGGEITQCKLGRAWREKPPTQKSALKAPFRKKRKGPAKKTAKRTTPKRNNPDVITLKQICEELGVGSYKVRKHFRAEGMVKPGKQWAWDKSQSREIKKIKSIIKKMDK